MPQESWEVLDCSEGDEWDQSAFPTPDRRHPQQHMGCYAVLVGFPFPFPSKGIRVLARLKHQCLQFCKINKFRLAARGKHKLANNYPTSGEWKGWWRRCRRRRRRGESGELVVEERGAVYGCGGKHWHYVSREEIVIGASSFKFVRFISCSLASSPIGSSSRTEDFANMTLMFSNGQRSCMGWKIYNGYSEIYLRHDLEKGSLTDVPSRMRPPPPVCVCVISHLASRYLRSKGPWQRLRHCPRSNSGLLCAHFLSSSGAAGPSGAP